LVLLLEPKGGLGAHCHRFILSRLIKGHSGGGGGGGERERETGGGERERKREKRERQSKLD
jgi:hypothetical protein